MAFFITKPSLVSESITLYYKGGNRWSDNPSDKITYETESEASSICSNPDGSNGGFKGSIVVSE
jgi:hypothetical protein